MTKFARFNLVLAVMYLVLMLSACGGWTGEATSVINILVLAIPMLVNVILAFSEQLSQPVIDNIKKWSAEAVQTLKDVKDLIAQFATSTVDDQQTIVAKIQASLTIVADSLATLLPDLHIVNPTVQRLITLVVTEFSALLGIIPVLQGKVTNKMEVRRLHDAVLDHDEFKDAWNEQAKTLGAAYVLHT